MKTSPVRFGRKGFTLIELLIVIVIIGILAGVVLVVLNPAKQQRRSQESVMKANLDKACLALYACAQTSTSAASCDTMNEIGVDSPTQPTGATYSVDTVDPITLTATLGGGLAGAKISGTACVWQCEYNFSASTAGALQESGTGCY